MKKFTPPPTPPGSWEPTVTDLTGLKRSDYELIGRLLVCGSLSHAEVAQVLNVPNYTDDLVDVPMPPFGRTPRSLLAQQLSRHGAFGYYRIDEYAPGRFAITLRPEFLARVRSVRASSK